MRTTYTAGRSAAPLPPGHCTLRPARTPDLFRGHPLEGKTHVCGSAQHGHTGVQAAPGPRGPVTVCPPQTGGRQNKQGARRPPPTGSGSMLAWAPHPMASAHLSGEKIKLGVTLHTSRALGGKTT